MVVVVVGFCSGFDSGDGGNDEERNYGGSGGAVAAGEGDVAVSLKLVSKIMITGRMWYQTTRKSMIDLFCQLATVKYSK
jgi:hypothetical protein